MQGMSAINIRDSEEGSAIGDALHGRTAIKLAAASLAADDPSGEFAAIGNQDSEATARARAKALCT